MRRVLAIYIPFLATDRLCERGDRRSSPVATVSPQGQTIRIVHPDAVAQGAYIRPGQTLAEAKAVVPELITFSDDPAADRRQIESLAVWAQCFSPTVHIEGVDTLLLDVTGCARLFRGEVHLVQQAIRGLAEQRFTGRGAIADTPGAAWALAHAHPEPTVVTEPGADASCLTPLPVWSLRIDAKTTDALFSVGVETIGALLHLPRSSLTSRFGDKLLDRLDQALGDLPEVLVPYRAEPVLIRRIAFGGATGRFEVLLEGIRQATAQFCDQLNRQTAGVRQLFATFFCPNVPSADGLKTRRATLTVNLSRATRSAGRLVSLLKVRLEELHLPAPADALAVWARHVEPLDDEQCELFESGNFDAGAVGELLDRLIVRLGPRGVVCPRRRSDHQPEYAFRYLSVMDASPPGEHRRSQTKARKEKLSEQESGELTEAGLSPERPLRLLSRPIPIAATSMVPDGPPIAFGLHGRRQTVIDCVGPERVETGWWRGAHVRRDYFRISTDAGRRCWVFRARDTGEWFLHGWFD